MQITTNRLGIKGHCKSRILSPSTYHFCRPSEYYKTFCNNIATYRLLHHEDDKIELKPRGGIPALYLAFLPDPNTFQSNTERTNGGNVEAVLYWQQV